VRGSEREEIETEKKKGGGGIDTWPMAAVVPMVRTVVMRLSERKKRAEQEGVDTTGS
jgi:hypothetical protein